MNTYSTPPELRNEKGKVTVPIVTLNRNGRYVVLIGMLHVASRSFFEIITSRLISLEKAGCQILYEKVEAIPSMEKGKLHSLFESLREYDLYPQLECIKVSRSWKSADLSHAEIESIQNDLDKYSDDGKENDIFGDPKRYVLEILLPQLEPSFSLPSADLLIDRRNEKAVEVILAYLRSSDVCSFWGCSHVPGIIALLSDEGYEIKEIEWVEAIDSEILKEKLSI